MSIVERSLEILRSLPDSELAWDGATLTGYAVVYGVTSAGPLDIGEGSERLYEQIDRGALDESLALNRNIPFVFGHSDVAELGDTASGTLALAPDEKGLKFTLKIPAYAKQLRAQIEKKIIRGMSFGMVPKLVEVRNGIRHIVKADLGHISAVYSPAYPQTTIEIVKPTTKLKMKMKLLELTTK